ncbi:MAG: S8 family serine peptidase [Betaproteobacteria bacterium]|nr:S8 family serine peptidase [Betaproteobacteria bacterium]
MGTAVHATVKVSSRRFAPAALLALCAIAYALPAAAQPTHLVVRFRDAATGTSSPADVARLQTIAAAARTGLAQIEITRDGAYRIALAPPLSDDGMRAALTQLRNEPSVLYADPHATPIAAAPAREPGPPIDRIIVKYRDAQVAADAAADLPLAPARVAQLAARAGRAMAFSRAVNWAGAHVLDVFPRVSLEEAEAIARAIEQDPDVEWAQPDYRLFPQLIPDDPLWASQWHYMAPPGEIAGANLPLAWDRTTGWSGARIAVIDTGVLAGHPDLAGRVIGGYDFISNTFVANDGDGRDADPSDPGDSTLANECFAGWPGANSSWHGTHVGGTIGAATNNALGVAGINHVSRVVHARALGKCGGSSVDVADAIVWSAGGSVAGVPANPFPAKVINMSLGGGGMCTGIPGDPITQGAINAALGFGASVIVAAGNSNSDAANFNPASCSGVLTVAALGRQGQRASYSNFGTVVELAAPGGSIADNVPNNQTVLSTSNSGTTVPLANGMNYRSYQGTSMATPHVAGVASLLYALKPSLTGSQVTNILQTNSRPFPSGTLRNCTTTICGAGMLDANLALTSVLNTGGPGGVPLVVPTSLAVASSANPALQGSLVTFTATIAGASGGTMAFLADDVLLAGCSAQPINSGQAQCQSNTLPNGTHSIRASYSGSATHTPRDSPILLQAVVPSTPQPSTTTVASTGTNPTVQGASATLTATVTGIAPSGTVEFRANNVPIAGCVAVALPGPGNQRTAQCNTTTLPIGQLAISAIYSGDSANLTSAGTTSHGVYTPSACKTFNDLASNDPFCPNVHWLYNRSITLGCDNVNYCPNLPVIRLQMAAFMNRDGTAMTPVDLPLVAGQIGMSLGGGNTVTCFSPTASFTAANFPRRARLRGFANLFGANANTTVAVQYAFSTDGGATWGLVPDSSARTRVASAADEDRTVNVVGEMDLAVGQTYLFGLAFSASPSVALTVYCANQARVHNRNGTAVPY